jgi:hypothetical protein
MKVVMARLGLKWSDKFSAANQDKIAREILPDAGARRMGRLQAPCTPARGGPIHTGQSYVVGEQGWEIFKPRQSGQIVNQKQLAAEGRTRAEVRRSEALRSILAACTAAIRTRLQFMLSVYCSTR